MQSRKNLEQNLLTYLGPLPPPEHRPSMSFLHHTQFWAVLPSSVQLSPMTFTSHFNSLLQLFLVRPRFLFPWGFHKRACRVVLLAGFRRVWPIQPHFLLLTCSAISSSSARSHSCLLVTLSFQQDSVLCFVSSSLFSRFLTRKAEQSSHLI